MKDINLSKNQLGVTPAETKQMAKEILSKLNS